MQALSFLLLLATAAPTPAATWHDAPGAELDVALVTIGPGEVYWERFGHNALLVRDRSTGSELLYNYGIFDFEQKSFLANFVRGLMQYRVVADDPRRELAWYRQQGRSIDVQQLELSPAQRTTLRDHLEWNVRPENTWYRYDYFTSNCSTKVRDALDRALGGALARATQGRSRGFTFRMHALRLMAPDRLVYGGIHAGLAGSTDRPVSFWDEMYVPMEVQKHVRDVTVVDDAGATVPLVASERRVADARIPAPSALPPDRRAWFLGAGLALAMLLVALHARRANAPARAGLAVVATTLVLVSGLGGVALAALWAATDHVAAHANENLLLFSPLALLLVPAALTAGRSAWAPGRFARGVALAIAALAAFALFAKVLPMFRQSNVEWILLWLPVHVAIAWIVRRPADA